MTPRCSRCDEPLPLTESTIGALVVCRSCGAGHSAVVQRDGERVVTLLEEAPTRATSLTGELAARFDVVARLGRGGEAEVLRVRPRGATRDYALKWSRCAAEGERATREAFYATVPAHPNVLVPLQVGWSAPYEYLVFDLVEGESLAELLERDRLLHPDHAAEIAHQILRALAHIHTHGVIHRDVKPANLLVARDGTVRLTDFGVATAVAPEPASAIVGTALYMAPEQVTCDVPLPASDVYAFGGVLFRMLAGECPFEELSQEDLLMARVCEPARAVAPLAPECPALLAEFVARCLALHPASRPADGREALRELAQVQRACGFSEYVDTAPMEAAPLAAGQEMQRTLAGASGWLLEAAVSCGLFFYAVRTAPGGAAWAAALAALFLLGRALAGLSVHLRGEPGWWWRSYVPWLATERVETSTITMLLTLATILALLMVGGVHFIGWLVLPLGLWLGFACTGVCSLVPAVLEGTPRSGATGAPELRVMARETGWMYRTGAGPARSLTSRIPLQEGLNRLEVWLEGGLHRKFLVWGVPGPPHRIELVDTPEGPTIPNRSP